MTCQQHTEVSFMLFAVIGRGGEQINKIQQESACKVQIAQGTVGSSVEVAKIVFIYKSHDSLQLNFPFDATDVLHLFVSLDSGGLPDRSVSLTGSDESIQ